MNTDRMTLQQKSTAVAVLRCEGSTTRELGDTVIYHESYSWAGERKLRPQRLRYDAMNSVVKALVRRGVLEQAGSAHGGGRTWKVTDEARGIVSDWAAWLDANAVPA
jgi:hypothetical protein